MDLDSNMFYFVGSPSIDMEKSIYGLGFDSLGRQRGWWGFVAMATHETKQQHETLTLSNAV